MQLCQNTYPLPLIQKRLYFPYYTVYYVKPSIAEQILNYEIHTHQNQQCKNDQKVQNTKALDFD